MRRRKFEKPAVDRAMCVQVQRSVTKRSREEDNLFILWTKLATYYLLYMIIADCKKFHNV